MKDMPGCLGVRVIRGINLLNRDRHSASDPYVVITSGKKETKSTRTVRNNCNPVWNEVLPLPVTNPNDPIKLSVYDRDVFSRDDPMGDAEINISPFIEDLKNGKIIQNMHLKLRNVKQGEVEIKLEWIRESTHKVEFPMIWGG